GRGEHVGFRQAVAYQAVDRRGVHTGIVDNHLGQQRVLIQGERRWAGLFALGRQFGDPDDRGIATQTRHVWSPRSGRATVAVPGISTVAPRRPASSGSPSPPWAASRFAVTDPPKCSSSPAIATA